MSQSRNSGLGVCFHRAYLQLHADLVLKADPLVFVEDVWRRQVLLPHHRPVAGVADRADLTIKLKRPLFLCLAVQCHAYL